MTVFNEIQQVCTLLATQCTETRLKSIESEMRARPSEAQQLEYGRSTLMALTGCPNDASANIAALLTCSQGIRTAHTTLAANLGTEFDRYNISAADRVLFGNTINTKPTLTARVQFYQDSSNQWKAQAEQKEKDARKKRFTQIGLMAGGLLLVGAALTVLVRNWVRPSPSVALPLPRPAFLRR